MTAKPPAQRCREWRERYPEKVKAYTKKYMEEHPEKIKTNNAKRKERGYYGGGTKGYANSPIGWSKYKIASLKRSAKIRGHEFNLTYKDILALIVPTCPVLGITLDYSLGGHKEKILPSSPSVDRINNNKGYIVGNVIIVSQLANKVKHNLTLEELVLYLPKMVDFYGRFIDEN